MPLDPPAPAARASLPQEAYSVEWEPSVRWEPPLRCPYCATSFASSRGLTLVSGPEPRTGAFCPTCGSFRYSHIPPPGEVDQQYAGAAIAFTEELAHYVIPIGNSLPATLNCLAGMRPQEGAFASVLDVGCGFGFSLLACREGLGLSAVGLEPSPSSTVGSRHLGVPIEHRYLDAFRQDHPHRFDLVSANGVVEHVPDPEDFVRQLWEASAIALSFLVPAAEGLAPETPRPRLFGCLSPGSHLTMMSEAGARVLAERMQVPHCYLERTGELMTVWYSRVPLVRTPPERLHDAAVDTALACLQSDDDLLWQGGLNRLLMLCGDARYAAWRPLALALADDFLDRRAPGLRRDALADLSEAPTIAYSLLFMGAVEAIRRAEPDDALARLRAARRHILHLKAHRPIRAIHALNIEGPINKTIGELEARLGV